MLDAFIRQLSHELQMADLIVSQQPGHYNLPFEGNIQIEAIQSPETLCFKGVIGNYPEGKTNDFISKMMEANLFAQQTRGAAIGLNSDGKLLTLSLEVDYNSSYKEWKEKLEDFANVLEFWKKEVGE